MFTEVYIRVTSPFKNDISELCADSVVVCMLCVCMQIVEIKFSIDHNVQGIIKFL